MLKKGTTEELESITVLGQGSRQLNSPLCSGQIYLREKKGENLTKVSSPLHRFSVELPVTCDQSCLKLPFVK